MASSQDTEITLGTAKLLGLFFGLVVICAVFFALGYTLGRKSDSVVSGTSLVPLQSASGAKPATSGATAPMTFYKAVEQQNGSPQLTPATVVAGTAQAGGAQPSGGASHGSSATANSASPSRSAIRRTDPMAPIPGTGVSCR